ncbi:BtrH N-terminal domain-containing protein [Halospeciosus flavus]|uniref:BtrH N-terminal domain-containing protein n=1 Tax=Halospeciosus flavus TaxID=3032283 RepID=A0ABD5Z1C3_9EURY|nr:BtrH N-terminal domain-containing protein [Halospeciosus flavus]
MHVDGFEYAPGAHCGSAALRDLATFYGWRYTEPACFGLGSGLGFEYTDRGPAERLVMGRRAGLETDFFDALGVDYTHREGQSRDEAWSALRERLAANTPVALFVDLYYLDYFGTDTHFGPHTLLCVGIDEDADEVVLADGEFDDRQRVGRDELDAAWSSEYGFGDLDRRWLAVDDPQRTVDTPAAVVDAVRTTADVMLDGREEWGGQGVDGIRAFADDLPTWPDLDDPAWTARFAYQNVERRGTGGGAFRRLFADFLAQLGEPAGVPGASADRAARLADQWSALGATLREASEAGPDEQVVLFERAAEQAHAVADAEERLFEDVRAGLDL